MILFMAGKKVQSRDVHFLFCYFPFKKFIQFHYIFIVPSFCFCGNTFLTVTSLFFILFYEIFKGLFQTRQFLTVSNIPNTVKNLQFNTISKEGDCNVIKC